MIGTVFLDLDRTLYRTSEGTIAIWQEVARQYESVDAQAELARQSEFYAYDGDSYAYDLAAHLTAVEVNSDEVYQTLRQSGLADGRLAFDGAVELVEWLQSVTEVKVLTYGVEDYQRLKVALLPFLDGVEVLTTLGSKGEYFRAHPQENTWMVDDKNIARELPSGVNFIQVSLEGAPFPDGADWPTATSLREVQGILRAQSY